ncbi:MAG: alpha/beta fold hydrolase [Alphaproteobacteria bacterium]
MDRCFVSGIGFHIMPPITLTPGLPDAEKPNYLTLANGERLAYHAYSGGLPRIVFLGGFTSDMTGQKATYLGAWAQARGQAYLRFDYSGHGLSDGRFEDGSIGRWTEDALAMIDACGDEPLVLVGSSMGGWIMVLAALARPERIHGLVGIAAAPDFTEDLVWRRLSADEQAAMIANGGHRRPSPYDDEGTLYTHHLVEEGRKHLLLRAPIELDMPVRLLHGTADEDVPWRVSATLLERLTNADATLTLIKDGDHRLSSPQQLAQLVACVGELCGN